MLFNQTVRFRYCAQFHADLFKIICVKICLNKRIHEYHYDEYKFEDILQDKIRILARDIPLIYVHF